MSDALDRKLRQVYDAFDMRNHKVITLAWQCCAQASRSLACSHRCGGLHAAAPCMHANAHGAQPPCELRRWPALQLALKLATAGLQKYPDSHIMKALKGVALERNGKQDEALKVGLGLCKSRGGRGAGC